MCILIIKEMGAKFPSMKRIKESVKRNPDGFGMAISDGESLTNYRTMSADDFLKHYEEIIKKLNYKKVSMLIHARISTHGSNCTRNCHCWIDGDIAFAHNGVLRIDNREDMTDSETFFQDIFMPIYSNYEWETAERAIRAVIGSSKFGFLFANGEIKKFGDFIKENDGCYYSNSSYKPLVEKTFYRYGGINEYNTYYPTSYNRSNWYDDYYDDYLYEDSGYIGEKAIQKWNSKKSSKKNKKNSPAKSWNYYVK